LFRWQSFPLAGTALRLSDISAHPRFRQIPKHFVAVVSPEAISPMANRFRYPEWLPRESRRTIDFILRTKWLKLQSAPPAVPKACVRMANVSSIKLGRAHRGRTGPLEHRDSQQRPINRKKRLVSLG
jgi:hypothetical protein